MQKQSWNDWGFQSAVNADPNRQLSTVPLPISFKNEMLCFRAALGFTEVAVDAHFALDKYLPQRTSFARAGFHLRKNVLLALRSLKDNWS